MESSHIFGDAEECHSSESGWTMYIGSPIDSDDGGDEDGDDRSDDGDDNDGDCDDHSVKRDEDSDDSMASDASSGPSHRGHSWGNGKEHHQVDKKAKKPVEMEKSGNARRKQEKEKSVFAAKGTNVGTESSDKVRKNSWFGKRK